MFVVPQYSIIPNALSSALTQPCVILEGGSGHGYVSSLHHNLALHRLHIRHRLPAAHC